MSEVEECLTHDAESLAEARPQPTDSGASLSVEERKNFLSQSKDIHSWRKWVLIGLCLFIGLWSIAVLLLILILPEKIAIALLVTTFANVVALTAIAFNWLFPKSC